jgi:dipeptidyl aminopeptidase/acylaminoacyl peptidase
LKHFLTLLMALAIVALPLNAVEKKEIGNLVIEDIPDIPESLKDRLSQYQNTRSASLRSWSADGDFMIISTRFGETSQFHKLTKPGGARQQITFFNEPVGAGSMNPDNSHNGFLFTKDVGGGEFYQIFHFDLNNGSYRMLTDGKSRHGSPMWSNKGDRFVYYSTKRNQKDWDIVVATADKVDEGRIVLQEGGTWVATDWSPDDSKLLVLRYISANESYYHIVDVASGRLEQINPDAGKIAYGGAQWSKDGKAVFFTADIGSEFQHLFRYDLASKAIKDLTPALKWNVSGVEMAPDGGVLLFTTNEDAMSKLYLMDLEDYAYAPVKNVPVGQVYNLSFHPNGKDVGMVINTPKTPGDVFVYNLDSKSFTRWTYSEVGGLNTDAFVTPELIRYPTFDKDGDKPREIPAFVYRPKTKGPHPVLISIHGGPEAQYNPYFSSTLQYWVNELGIAVIAPNVRGSSGYGKAYLQLDNGFLRENSVKDIGALLDWIEEQPGLDKDRVGVIGGSYGGYMVLASMVHYNDRLACGIDIVGISNFVTFLKNTKDYRRDLRRVEYGDERDPEMNAFLEKISPNNNADKINKPLFVVQGLNDPRVPVGEAEQIVKAVRDNGGKVWYLLAKDEGHGFRKKKNRDYYNQAVVLFLQQHLVK